MPSIGRVPGMLGFLETLGFEFHENMLSLHGDTMQAVGTAGTTLATVLPRTIRPLRIVRSS